MTFMLVLESLLLGVGLAMDATSVSMADGMNEPTMSKRKMFSISGLFGFFQALMPLVGWICVHTILTYFKAFEKAIPYIALGLLLFIGIKMIVDGIKTENDEQPNKKLGITTLFVQAVATSIDALSVGFTIAAYSFAIALISVLIVGIITFGLCLLGLFLGKKFGTKFSNKAQIVGGVILIIIGLEIFLTGIL